MSLFNIDSLTTRSEFDLWLSRFNQVITGINNLNIYDVLPDTDRGLLETSRIGGILTLGIDAGPAMGFDATGKLTIGGNGGTSTSFVARPAVNDKFVVVNSAGEAKYVRADDVLAGTVENDIDFTGDITFSGNVQLVGNIFSDVTSTTRFTDKNLEIGVVFDDLITTGDGITGGSATWTAETNAYLIEEADRAGFVPGASVALAYGEIEGTTLATKEIRLQNVVFTTPGDAWANYEGATAGTYTLINSDNTAFASDITDVTNVLTTEDNYASDADLNNAGILVLGVSGTKEFTWIDANKGWTTDENLIVGGTGAIRTSEFKPLDGDNEIRITGEESSIPLVVKIFEETNEDSFEIVRFGNSFADDDRANGLEFAYGPSTGSRIPHMNLRPDGSIIFNSNQPLATNLNADLLDGAQGSTTAAPNVIPISGTDGSLDEDFLTRSPRISFKVAQTSHGLTTGDIVFVDQSTDLYAKSIASGATTAEVVGVISSVEDADNFTITTQGRIQNFAATNGLEPGEAYFLSATSAGDYTPVGPTTPGHVRKVVFTALTDRNINVVNFVGSVVPNPTDTVYLRGLMPLGSIQPLAAAPNDLGEEWVECNGQAIASNNYAALLSLIDQKYYANSTINRTSSSQGTFVIAGGSRNLEVGDTLNISWAGGSRTNADITAIDSDTIISIDNGSGTSLPATGTAIQIRASGQKFFVPDLRSRAAVGDGTNDLGVATALGENKTVTGQSGSSTLDLNLGTKFYIRAKNTANATVVSSDLNYDFDYPSFNNDQTAFISESQRSRARQNLGVLEETDLNARYVAFNTDQNTTTNAQRLQARKNIGMGSESDITTLHAEGHDSRYIPFSDTSLDSNFLTISQKFRYSEITNTVPRTGGQTARMTGDLWMGDASDSNTHRNINGLRAPTRSDSATNKSYVDNSIANVTSLINNNLLRRDIPQTVDTNQFRTAITNLGLTFSDLPSPNLPIDLDTRYIKNDASDKTILGNVTIGGQFTSRGETRLVENGNLGGVFINQQQQIRNVAAGVLDTDVPNLLQADYSQDVFLATEPGGASLPWTPFPFVPEGIWLVHISGEAITNGSSVRSVRIALQNASTPYEIGTVLLAGDDRSPTSITVPVIVYPPESPVQHPDAAANKIVLTGGTLHFVPKYLVAWRLGTTATPVSIGDAGRFV